jgi:hypothetical protein
VSAVSTHRRLVGRLLTHVCVAMWRASETRALNFGAAAVLFKRLNSSFSAATHPTCPYNPRQVSKAPLAQHNRSPPCTRGACSTIPPTWPPNTPEASQCA